MKAIMLSMQPQWVAKILNGEKNIEIRKRFPINYVGWVYVYCTKKGETIWGKGTTFTEQVGEQYITGINYDMLNGKVVARFWCDKAIHITKLEIFDTPKELKEFNVWRKKTIYSGMDCPPYVDDVNVPLTRAPLNWCWVEGEEE